jgi:hypothetical protein
MFSLNPDDINYYKFLFDLRKSGICNMMESSIYLERKFPELDKRQSEEIVLEWMQNCEQIEQKISNTKISNTKISNTKISNTNNNTNNNNANLLITTLDDSDLDIKTDLYSDLDSDSDSESDGNNYTKNSYWSNNGKYQQEYDRLFKKYVPSSGATDSEQGHILRVVSRIAYRFYNDGDEDMSEHKRMLNESPLPTDLPLKFYRYFGNFDDRSLTKMIDIVVKYALKKEKFDIEHCAEDNAKHEARYMACLKQETEWKNKFEREDA